MSGRWFIFYEWEPYHGTAVEALCLQVYELEAIVHGCTKIIKFSNVTENRPHHVEVESIKI
jgi:hypothetical protein